MATGRASVRPSRRPEGSEIAGVLFGVGAAAFVDETVFHQLLHWHHFYDKSTTDVGLVSDGLFHAFGWFAVVAGLFWLASLRSHRTLNWWRRAGGALLGAGGFQLYDGTVQHKTDAAAPDPRSASTPPHVTSAAMIMCCGGEAVSIIVMIILCARWIRDPRRVPFHELGQARTS
jgi:hypothetical protein